MLYHCFPRRPYSYVNEGLPLSDKEAELGKSILESIFRFGLLLKPEEALKADPLRGPDSNASRPSTHPRCCFTENDFDGITVPEVPFQNGLRSHLDIFGHFAIGVENSIGRQLGINPCNYYYRTANDLKDAGTHALSEHLLGSLTQIRNTLVVLSEMESIANPNDDYPNSGNAIARHKLKKINVCYHNESDEIIEKISDKLRRLSGDDAKTFDQLLCNTHYPFWYLTQQLTFLIHLFQNADSQKNRRELAYYAQREWRLVQFFHGRLKFLPVSEQPEELILLNPGEREVVDLFLKNTSKICFDFREVYGKDIDFDGSWILFRFGEYDFREFISEIIVPDNYAERVGRAVEDLWVRGRFRRGKPRVVSSNPNKFIQ